MIKDTINSKKKKNIRNIPPPVNLSPASFPDSSVAPLKYGYWGIITPIQKHRRYSGHLFSRCEISISFPINTPMDPNKSPGSLFGDSLHSLWPCRGEQQGLSLGGSLVASDWRWPIQETSGYPHQTGAGKASTQKCQTVGLTLSSQESSYKNSMGLIYLYKHLP